ncbi:MAG: hypothetical protein J7525_19825 [Roseofilum sp. SID3]|uniref:hypothetical protein n=1 Tax=Roseofilum sp. SID3 TaxID=2821499 RepID=UPI001B115702|nr:hypothetical protein [Roseofilum sp. SID3]MBP0015346.1 hypothetical protein [Roseofilum sp. SID3]
MDREQFVERNTLLNMSSFVQLDMYEEKFPDHEVMEVWAVSDQLGDRLIAKGEAVLRIGGVYVWGRACCGQAIKMDSVIQEIFNELPGVKA